MKTILALAATAALAAAPGVSQAAVYADVISSVPVTGAVSVPRESCNTVEQIVERPSSGAGALLGAVAGGLLGNTIGHGFGRAAATGAGVVAGAAIGDRVESGGRSAQVVPVERCRTVRATESRTVGYDVTYEYAGQRYTTRLPYDPGPRLALDIRPAGAAPRAEPVRPAAPRDDGWDRMGTPVPPAYSDVDPAGTVLYDDDEPYEVVERAPRRIVYAAPAIAAYPVYPAPYYAAPALSVRIGGGWDRGYRHYRGRDRHWR
ncbi:glycine zipper 2TM domain-containing protein [Piscinibacter koreensis]|uniref:Glycine zipper 2TM domain-containing protein n=1 Tax=Piscinibacter koreensis TaxID=2742824 RepID=A0A7Y6NKD3_9BURK|nr:glycine zipper 2TM domain-containing protein [Schlegelella koreensis]NUZ04691.1 glycine zipper 2TM domain-containing protein [Schlegelella koreensis]